MPPEHQFILAPASRDAKGIVDAVSGPLGQAGCNIVGSQQSGDLEGDDFTPAGRDIECMVLARAVRWHVEHRVPVNGHKCVVLR